MRCENCRQIDIDNIRDGRNILQQPSFPDLRRSAESGCDLCHLSYVSIVTERSDLIDRLQRGIYPRDETEQDFDTEITLSGEVHDYYSLGKLRERSDKAFVGIGASSPGRNLASRLMISAELGTPPAKYIAGRLPSQNPGHQATMTRVKKWVRNCDSTHKKCASRNYSVFPTRILDIKGKPIVIETRGRMDGSERQDYVALSYCWGRSGKNLCLTMEKDSSTAMSIFDVFTSTGIEMDQLPKTVQDAIVVCRELGVDYLWVDALCIIQEQRDLEDFKVEALKMSQYYENAYLTLIIGSAPDCADGFLNDLPEPKAPPCEIGYGRMALGTLYPESDTKGLVKLSLPRDSAKGPLSKRAWPFQEEKLSRRTLTYASEMVLFSCQTMSVNEEGSFSIIPSAAADPANFDPHHFDLHTLHDLTTHDDNSKSQELAFERWRQSLILYTELQMSNSMDKLAAIAGYAKFLGSVIRCKYMYGLWKDDLHVELLWKPVYATSTLKCVTRAVDRAPSWSWASIDGRVSMSLSPPMRDMIQNPENQRLAVLDCKNISGSYDPIRANKSGSRGFELNVRGPLTTLWPAQKWGKYKQEYVSLRANADGEEIAIGSWDTLKDYQSKQYLDYMIYALLVVRGKGLLLAKIQGSDHYRRIGTFRSLEKEDIFIRDQEIIII